MKKTSYYWSALAGVLSIFTQVATFKVRFGSWNADVPFTDYLAFFAAGLLGGLMLIWFLNRQGSTRGWWIVLGMFLLVSPVAMIFMLGGGMLGPLGVLIFPQIPWGISALIGAGLAKLFSPKN